MTPFPEWGPYGKFAPSVSHIDAGLGESVDFVFVLRLKDGRALVPRYDDGETGRLDPDIRQGCVEAGFGRFGYRIFPDAARSAHLRVDCRNFGRACRVELAADGANGAIPDYVPEVWAVRPKSPRDVPRIHLGEGAVWRGAEAYAAINSKLYQAYDGYGNMVQPEFSAVGGAVLGRMWAASDGTCVVYRVSVTDARTPLRIGVRYRKPRTVPGFRQFLRVGDARVPLDLPVSREWRWHWPDVAASARDGSLEWRIETEGDGEAEVPRTSNGDPMPPGFFLDGFVVVGDGKAPDVEVDRAGDPFPFCPEAAEGNDGLTCRLVPVRGADAIEVRLPERAERLLPGGDGDAAAFSGLPEEAGDVLAGWRLGGFRDGATEEGTASICLSVEGAAAMSGTGASAGGSGVTPGATDYPAAFGAMAASCRMNVSFPVILGGRSIAAHTPGKRWGGLYSWDAGMHGIGLLELDAEEAFACIHTYLTDPEDPQPFVWHGSPVPTQAYLWWELWQRERDPEKLAWVFPRLLRYFRFLSGSAAGSTTDRFGNGLPNTFPLFYNTGGWDDLPPQVAVHRADLTERVTPVIGAAHVVRFARILRTMALDMGEDDVIDEMDRAVAHHLAAIERTWDDAAGVYSYVWHEDFSPFRHSSGRNYNHTLDGLSPLLSGGISGDRAERLWEALADPRRFMTPCGITAVDQSAPYYAGDGYWNGTVWMPYQWLLWKAALDHGRAGPALAIPRRAAEMWEREVSRTGHTAEYFRVADGKAGGYPLFAGLSAPILGMIAALSVPGRVTTGFDAEVRGARFRPGGSLSFEARVHGTPGARPSALIRMAGAGRYTLRNEAASEAGATFATDEEGLAVVALPSVPDWTSLRVEPA